jgi:hypothetical protein
MDPDLLLFDQQHLELETAQQLGHRHQPAEHVLDAALLRGAATGQHLAALTHSHDQIADCDRSHHPHRMLTERVQLPTQRRETAGLDLDQQVTADDVDDVGADRVLDEVALPAIPLLDLSVERPFREGPDRRPGLGHPGTVSAGRHRNGHLDPDAYLLNRARSRTVGQNRP